MKVSNHKKRVKGRAASKKVYEYTIKSIGSLRFNDIVEIMGVDAACKFFEYFAGCYIYIPTKKSIKTDFVHALIRHEAGVLKTEELKINKVVEILAGKYGLHQETVYKILGLKNSDTCVDTKLFKQKIKIDEIRDTHLLAILSEHWKLLKKYGLL
jgi:hypothetical protein